MTRPEQVLEAWRNAPRSRGSESVEFYSPLNGRRLEEAVRQALHEAQDGRHPLLASYSAAHVVEGRMPDGRQNSVELLVATIPALLVTRGPSPAC